MTAKVVADSKNEFGNRITTMEVTFPRFILAEFNTHRMFSRNSASSRAIPFKKLVQSVKDDPFIPMAWQKEHKGMQGTEYLNEEHSGLAVLDWKRAMRNAINEAETLSRKDVTKQLANRLLEPFIANHKVLVTATEWENFFALRCPRYSLFYEQIPMEFRSKKDLLKFTKQVEAVEFKNQYDNLSEIEWLQINKGQAEIHMMALAEAMWDAYNESTPELLKNGEWHIPYKDKIIDPARENEFLSLPIGDWKGDAMEFYEMCKVKLSTVMCARTSYTVVGEDQKPLSYQRMIELDDNLINANPVHASPMEHCAESADDSGRYYNLNGFKSRRYLLNK